MKNKILLLLLVISCFAVILMACQDNQAPKTTEPSQTTEAPETADTATPETTTPEPSTAPATTTDDNQTTVVYNTVQNPVLSSGADPWIVNHNGAYYYIFASGNYVSISKFDDLSKMHTRDTKVVYTAPAGTEYSSEYWAPELHYLNGEWYIYVAADNGDNANHRMYVLKGTSQNPQDPFEMVGKISDPSNKWAIDGTILEYKGELYFIWSGWKGDTNVAQHIYIAHMSDPCTIDSERVMLSTPVYMWERQGTPYVNEGPTILKNGDDVFLIYSASGSWTDDYCLGMLTLTGDDPLVASNWKKSSTSVFKKVPGVAYGPGHCSFSTAADGSVWMIYHANLVSGSSWGGRSVWISPVTFSEKGTPIFGTPSKEVQFPVVKGN